MKNAKSILPVLFILLGVSLSCSLIKSKVSGTKSSQPTIDFTSPGKALDVKVQLEKTNTASAKISSSGGSISLTGKDGSKFTLDVPANALETVTEISMTTVKSIDGAPLDKTTPTAVQ